MAEKKEKQKKNVKIKKPRKGKAVGRIILPTKNYINLAAVGQKRTNYKLLVLETVITVIVLAAILKFGVYDMLAEKSRAEREAAEVRHQVNMAYEEIENYGDLNEKYAHYTYSGMTQEELTRVDRIEIIDMLQRVVIPQAALSSWNISKNLISMSIKSTSLEAINNIAKQLEQESIVDYVTVSTAVTGTETIYNKYLDTTTQVGEGGLVISSLTVYLTNEKEEASE